MRWTPLLLVILLAAVSFGGTFSCSSGSDHHDDHDHDHPPKATTP